MLPRWLRVYVIPAGVFQSVIVGGAYGTGREVAEYLSRFGPLGGLYACGLIILGFALVIAASFEFARLFQTWDYRGFVKCLLGPGWMLYEICFVTLLVIALAVTGAAAAGSKTARACSIGMVTVPDHSEVAVSTNTSAWEIMIAPSRRRSTRLGAPRGA